MFYTNSSFTGFSYNSIDDSADTHAAGKTSTGLPLLEVIDEEVEHVDGEGYGVVLFNDDSHSVDEVIQQVVRAVNCPVPVAIEIVMKAHNVGWAIVTVTDLEEANRVARILREISLIVEVKVV